jgi:hypothetical protein
MITGQLGSNRTHNIGQPVSCHLVLLGIKDLKRIKGDLTIQAKQVQLRAMVIRKGWKAM